MTASFSVFALRRPGTGGGPRAGFTTPRALGKAVVRNRMRRRMREAVRLEFASFAEPVDLVFHPRRNILEAPFKVLRAEVAKVLSQCGNL